MTDQQFDPFAVLRAIENGQADMANTADLFAGSEPVAASPDTAPESGAGEPVAAPAAAPAAEPAMAAADPAIASSADAVMMRALLQLEARIAAIEALAQRNGWPL